MSWMMPRKDLKSHVTCGNLTKFVFVVLWVSVFTIVAILQYQDYQAEHTGSSLQWESPDNLPFPAVSICDNHYHFRRALQELNFQKSPFLKIEDVDMVRVHPETSYRMIRETLELNLTVVEFIWEYYFTLDQILKHSDQLADCSIGEFSCLFDTFLPPGNFKGQNGSESVDIEVPAGTWTSRTFADSKDGSSFMCHTIKPNVSVDFGVAGGNVIQLAWNRDYFNMTTYWSVFVHDKYETVLLPSYAMEGQPKLTLVPGKLVEGTSSSVDPLKKKAIIVPTRMILPSSSKVLPCNDSARYSKNLCTIKQSWVSRFQEMEAAYGSRFQCQLPGIWIDEPDKRPVCSDYDPQDKDKPLGLYDLFRAPIDHPDLCTLAAPPIGIYKEDSDCQKRCDSYTYKLQEEEVTIYDGVMRETDLYLYFASSTVETWTEYRLVSFLGFISEIGGTLGLLLGASALSLVFLVIDALQMVLKMPVMGKHY